jgi:hypothetical protein
MNVNTKIEMMEKRESTKNIINKHKIVPNNEVCQLKYLNNGLIQLLK